MNLFAEDTQNLLLAQGFEDGWINALSQNLDAETFQSILLKVENERKNTTVFPAEEDMFKIFKECPFNSIKVVIIGQDPYHNGNANGVAFACKEFMSPSLRTIFNTMIKSGFCSEPVKNRPSLRYLIEQGVFLYNTILTVKEGEPLSHQHLGWSSFTQAVIKTLNTKEKLVWLLWGKYAKDFQKYINPQHISLQAEHPAAAARNQVDWKCTHFIAANDYLKSKNLTPINW